MLYKTNCNAKNAYLALYDKTDDYVILNLRDKLYYNLLIEQRGKESVSQRESFLGVKRIN